MLERMSSQELTEWLAFYTLEPFGGETQYVGHAITAATVANSNRGKGKKAAKVEDFMPKFGPKKAQTVEEQIQFAAMFTAAMGGTVDLGGEE
jgi:hypothetical protein